MKLIDNFMSINFITLDVQNFRIVNLKSEEDTHAVVTLSLWRDPHCFTCLLR